MNSVCGCASALDILVFEDCWEGMTSDEHTHTCIEKHTTHTQKKKNTAHGCIHDLHKHNTKPRVASKLKEVEPTPDHLLFKWSTVRQMARKGAVS